MASSVSGSAMYNDDVNEIKFRLQSIKILQVFLYSFKSVDDFSLLETLLVSFFKCSSTGKGGISYIP